MGSLNAEPIAPRSALGENGSDVPRVAISPLAPAASAVRQIAPTFTGSLMPCKTSSKGFAGCLSVKVASSDEATFTERQPANPLLLVLHGINDPVNVGAICRTAEAAGASGLIATRGTSDPFSPKALRGAMGS